MYVVLVLCLMLVFPAVGIGIEQDHAPLMLLVGKWFVFFGVGWRLLIAGIRQIVQPRFTAEQIFHNTHPGTLMLVRELGFANLGAGIVGVASLWAGAFVLPAAIASGIFFAAAGVQHATEKNRGLNENVAMVSDLWIAVLLVAYVVWRLTA